MSESLLAWAAPYGGVAFVYIGFLAIASLIALLIVKKRLRTFTLKRLIRLGALVALPLTVIAMEMGEQHWPVAVIAIAWAIVVALICHTEASQRPTDRK